MRISALLLSAIAALLFITTSADAAVISTHDLLAQENKQYQVNGNDPYFVVQLESVEPSARLMLIDLTISQKNKSIDVFFKYADGVFSPWHRLSFIAADSGMVAVKLPDDAVVKDKQKLRIDVNDCLSCELTLKSARLVSSIESTLELRPTQTYNGVDAIPADGQDLALADWQLSSIKGSLQSFTIESNDPFLVSPSFNFATRNLAAVYFRLKTPKNKNVNNDFQLFYATENHGFTEHATSLLRVENKKTRIETDDTSVTELLFPLEFLSREIPADVVLRKIRLDLPLIAGDWSLEQAKLLSFEQLELYQAQLPEQVIHTKRQRSAGLSLVKKSIKNVLSDLAFTLAYLVLLMIVAAGFIREYRK